MIAAIEAALKHDVAGEPITGIRWTRRTTEKIAQELAALDIQVCPRTVARILKDLGYRLRVNHKRVAAGSGPDRDEQFQHIAAQRLRTGLSVVAQLVEQEYPTGVKIADAEFASIALQPHQTRPLRNYTICPRS